MKKRDENLARKIREIEERIEALIIAIPKEEASHAFYMGLADTTTHEGAKKMFIELAEQELEHRRKLEDVIQSLKEELDRLKKQA